MPQKCREIENNKTKTLEAMAKALKYKNINWELIQNPYVPQGLLNQIAQERAVREGQVELAKIVAQMANKSNSTETLNQNK